MEKLHSAMGHISAYEQVSYRLNLFLVFILLYTHLLCALGLLHPCAKK